MKNLLNVLFILLFISSCSDTDNSTFPEINDEEENNTEKIIPLKLEKTHGKTFSIMPFLAYFPMIISLCFLYSTFTIQSRGKFLI